MQQRRLNGVCLLTEDFTDDPRNGVQSRILGLSKGLANKGITVNIVSDPISTRVRPSLSTNICLWETVKLPFDSGPLGFGLAAIYPVYRIFKEKKAEIVHGSWCGSTFGVALAKIRRKLEMPIIMTIDDLYTERRVDRAREAVTLPIYRKADKVAAMVADRVVAVSGRIASEMESLFNIRREKISVIRNGVDAHHFNPKNKNCDLLRDLNVEGGSTVLFVGHLTWRKGVDVLVRAARFVKDVEHEFKVLVVGTGPRNSEIEKLAVRCGVRSNFRFLGRVNSEVLRTLYATVDMFVLPSRYEGQPISILEAMASGAPVIVSKFSDVSEYVINGKTGLVVNLGDDRSLADAILKLIDDVDLGKKLAKEARKRIEYEFSWDTVCDKHIQIYENLL